jgi:hypothetical protein
MTITYTDPSLRNEATAPRKLQAAADVAAMGTFTTAWTERLTELRVYIIICQECMSVEGDLFHAKLKAYRDEFALARDLATAANDAENPGEGTGSALSCVIGRA